MGRRDGHQSLLATRMRTHDIAKVADAYARALAAGATGGKLLGAGGSGFLLFYCPNGTRDAVIDALRPYAPYDVRLDMIGTTIIYSD